MRKHICILLPVFVVIGLAVGCGDDEASKPVVTRLHVSEACGVAPLLVDFRGDAAGGEPLSDPSGTNNWLKFTWDFGDGTVIDNGTSIAYHQYDSAGVYTATLFAEDDAGERSSRSVVIDVRADSLAISAFSRVGDLVVDVVKTCEPVTFDITVGRLRLRSRQRQHRPLCPPVECVPDHPRFRRRRSRHRPHRHPSSSQAGAFLHR